jgi:hypothetical protein
MGKRARCLKPTLSSLDELGDDPSVLDALVKWDEVIANSIVGLEADRLKVVLESSIFGTTDYSGLDTPADTLPRAIQGFCRVHNVPPPPVRFVRSCDVGHIQQYVLVQRSRLTSGASHCVFTDLLDALDAKARAMVTAMEPREGASLAEAAAAYSQMESYLLAECKWAFPSSQTAWCEVHRQKCPMHVGCILGARSGASEAIYLLTSSAGGAATASAAIGQPWWASLDPIEPSQPPIVIHVAGLTCTDYSALGKQKHEAGHSNREHAAWIGTRKARGIAVEEDLYFTECAKHYRPSVRQAPLASTHHVVSLLIGPQLVGYPIYRLRGYAVGINRAKWVWVGPCTPVAVQSDFEVKFHRPVTVRGGAFLSASAVEVREFGSELASTTSNKLRISEGRDNDAESTSMADYLHLLCSPAMICRKANYEKYFTDNGIAPPWFADLDQNVGWGHGAVPSFVPTLVTHPRIYVWPKGLDVGGQRFLLPAELLTCQGFCKDNELHNIFKTLDIKSKGVLVGNGMHIPSLGAVMMYVLANIRPRSDFFTIAPIVSVNPADLWEDVDDVEFACDR